MSTDNKIPAVLIQAGDVEGGITTLTFKVSREDLERWVEDNALPIYEPCKIEITQDRS